MAVCTSQCLAQLPVPTLPTLVPPRSRHGDAAHLLAFPPPDCHLDEVTLAGDIAFCLRLAAGRHTEERWFLSSLPHFIGARVELSHRGF